MNANVLHALSIMGNGMLGIFVAILIIMGFVWVVSKIGSKKQEEKSE